MQENISGSLIMDGRTVYGERNKMIETKPFHNAAEVEFKP